MSDDKKQQSTWRLLLNGRYWRLLLNRRLPLNLRLLLKRYWRLLLKRNWCLLLNGRLLLNRRLPLNLRLLLHLQLIRIVLVLVMTGGVFWFSPKVSYFVVNVVNTVKNSDLKWTGFFKRITREEKIRNKTGLFIVNKEHHHYGKTLWDFLELGGTLAVPIVIAVLGFQLQQGDKKRAEENLFEEAIQVYLDDVGQLLLDKELRKELFPNVNDRLKPLDYDNPVREIVRVKTTTILRRLQRDKPRQKRIITFLKDARLFEFIFKNAHMSEIDLSGLYLQTDLSYASLENADLTGADLKNAKLIKTNLTNAICTKKQIISARHWKDAIFAVNYWDQKKREWKLYDIEQKKIIEELNK